MNKEDSSIKQWVVIDNYLRLNPTKEDLKHARDMRSITIPKRFIKDNGIVNLKRFIY